MIVDDVRVYWCVWCRVALPVIDGVIVHLQVPHPADATFDEDQKPQ